MRTRPYMIFTIIIALTAMIVIYAYNHITIEKTVNSKSNITRIYEKIPFSAGYVAICRTDTGTLVDIPDGEKARLYHSENQALRTIHSNALPADWSRAAGVINVSVGEQLNLVNNDYYASLEQVLLWDPDVIIANETTAMKYILGNPQWSGIKAVRNKRVYQLPQGISRWGHPGSVETPLAIMWTAKTVYPEKFEHIDWEKNKGHGTCQRRGL